MAFGFRSINTSGTFQIDSDSKNYRIAQSGSGSIPSFISFNFGPTFVPLIFVRSYGRFYASNISLEGFVIDSTAFYEYLILAPVAGPFSDTIGMRVFDASGAVVFDSGGTVIQIDHYSKVTAYHNSGTLPQTIILPTPVSGLRYVLVNPLSLFWSFSIPVGSGLYDNDLGYAACTINAENSITISEFQTFEQNSQNQRDFTSMSNISVVTAFVNT